MGSVGASATGASDEGVSTAGASVAGVSELPQAARDRTMTTAISRARTDYYILCHIAKLVNEGFYTDGGRIRGVPVAIGGTSYVPPLPIETVVKENIDAILTDSTDDVDTAIKLCLYCIKTQIFSDGNKRASVIFANHYMISKGQPMFS